MRVLREPDSRRVEPVGAVATGCLSPVGSQIERVLRESKTIGVVGLSPKSNRPSHKVASYLQAQGYRIIPVNPRVDEILGERSYPYLTQVPEPVDAVDIFRRSEGVLPIVEAAIAIGARAVWMQEGIVNEAAAERARAAGLMVIMDRCMQGAPTADIRARGGE